MERRFYEYRGMRGGEHYERMEANPMIGYRGCFRNVAESVGKADLRRIDLFLNDRPRKCLGWMTPRERMEEHIAKTG